MLLHNGVHTPLCIAESEVRSVQLFPSRVTHHASEGRQCISCVLPLFSLSDAINATRRTWEVRQFLAGRQHVRTIVGILAVETVALKIRRKYDVRQIMYT